MCSLPTTDAFVVFKFDPVESVAHLNNPELTAACACLETKEYVAFVNTQLGLFNPIVPYHSFTFYPIQQGLLLKDDEKGILPEMCTPILPNTSHPFSREPIDPGKPLPWSDCYISPFYGTMVRCPTIVFKEEPPELIQMTIEEAVRLSSLLNKDSESRHERMDELYPSTSQESLQEYARRFYEPSDSETDGDYESQPSISGSYLSEGHRSFLGRDPDRGSLSVHSHSEVSLGSSSDLMDHQEVSVREGSSQQSDSGVGEGQAEIVEEDPADFMDPGIWDMIVLKVSFNLSEVQRVNDPQGFIQEHGAFNRLKAEYEAARKQKEIDDARQIDENYFSKLADSALRPKSPSASVELSMTSRAARIGATATEMFEGAKSSMKKAYEYIFGKL